MGNAIVDKSFAFAVRIVKLYQYLTDEKREYVMSKQVMRSGTSIGANVCEAAYGQSRKDFLSKMHIALKEASETEYWLRLLKHTGYLEEAQFSSMFDDCMELKRMLHAIVKTTKSNTMEDT